MFIAHTSQAARAFHAVKRPLPSYSDRVMSQACSLYRLASLKRLVHRARSLFSHRPGRLLDLGTIEGAGQVRAHFPAGRFLVPLARIRGTARYQPGFDGTFHPLNRATRGRWLAVAALRAQGDDLPAVSLIQAGDLYFVCDGCCRVSVARALGQKYIPADVTLCQITGPLPWQLNGKLQRAGAWA
jgi:hypothetical protein